VAIRIGNHPMPLEAGRVVATATGRGYGWREVTYQPRFSGRSQAITADTITGLLESGYPAMIRSSYAEPKHPPQRTHDPLVNPA
jgi:hypothetical protein